ncbi:glycosyltransferase [Chryseobacterium chendengshani]|uniref:glycosyltransferase n=1 Tax=Chryseobacterium sp. LJ668 TaxID=2864040 RepID=UPI001C68A1F5|nr:glycosyltransferase [Chryseobacterium sp. LJ668]MBW8521825.1 glycosyltransferase [Chryseobacterium sp. LJ668]QYK17485.1 glycosyltransferase [Chryseobacterium sp. LJ668]
MNKVSVIVLTYNQEKFIEKNLTGIFMQKVNFPVELIISDDCSTDQTVLIINELIKNKPAHIEIKFKSHQKNLGSTPNFFNALQEATGKYIAFCEGDDYWTDENKLQIQYDFLEENKDYSMCFHQVKNISSNQLINDSLFATVDNKDYSPFEIFRHWIVHTTSVFMNAEVLQNHAAKTLFKHPELLYFDTFLYMACSLNGKIRGSDLTMSCYLRHEEGLSNGINYKRDLKHNHLDEIIAETYGGKVKEYANWQIFSRSRIAFLHLLKQGKFNLAFQHLRWILKKKGNLKIYLIKKYA